METTQEKLTKIEEVIRECCPELQELSFGCEVRQKDYEVGYGFGTFVREITLVNAPEEKGVQISLTDSLCVQNFSLYDFNRWFEIIGHPIHLEHILRAISEKRGDTVAEKCAADIVFKFYDTINKPFSLQSQSDEFISWLYEVLCG